MVDALPKRVLLKLSGEALLGPEEKFPFDPRVALRFSQEIRDAHDAGVQIAVVVGGGNIFRGAKGESEGMDRTPADQFGMLATLCNGIVLRDMLERQCDVSVRLMTALEVNKVAEPYIVQRATRHLQNGHVIILAGGTGNPFFTTDTAAALRASEIKADLLLKATNVDGIYDKDPRKHADATRFDQVSYDRCLTDGLEVMDTAAFALCRGQKVPIRAFSLLEPGNITRALKGEPIGTLVSL